MIKASTERKIIRWLHIVLSIPLLGYLYGPVASIPPAAFATKYVFLPTIILTGFWLWKGHSIKRKLNQYKAKNNNINNKSTTT